MLLFSGAQWSEGGGGAKMNFCGGGVVVEVFGSGAEAATPVKQRRNTGMKWNCFCILNILL